MGYVPVVSLGFNALYTVFHRGIQHWYSTELIQLDGNITPSILSDLLPADDYGENTICALELHLCGDYGPIGDVRDINGIMSAIDTIYTVDLMSAVNTVGLQFLSFFALNVGSRGWHIVTAVVLLALGIKPSQQLLGKLLRHKFHQIRDRDTTQDFHHWNVYCELFQEPRSHLHCNQTVDTHIHQRRGVIQAVRIRKEFQCLEL